MTSVHPGLLLALLVTSVTSALAADTAPPTVPTAIVERARFAITVPRQGPAQGILELDVQGLEPGWNSVPALGGDLVFVGLEGGDDVMLAGSASAPRLWLPGRGPRRVNLRFEAAVTPVSGDRRALPLALPASPILQVEIEFPGRTVQMAGPWAEGEGARFAFPLPARDRVELTWSEPASEGSESASAHKDGPDSCRMETLFTLHPGRILATTALHLSDDDGRARRFSFGLPAGSRGLRVVTSERGLTVPHAVETRDGGHTVTLASLPGERGPWDLTVSFSVALTGPVPSTPARPETTETVVVQPPTIASVTAPLPFLTPLGVERVGGVFVLSPTPEVEVSLADRTGTEEADFAELSPGFREQLRGLVVSARRFGTVPAAARVQVRTRSEAARTYPIIGHMAGETEVTTEGHVRHRVTMHVTNATTPRLELALPPAATLASLRVDGLAVLPPTASTTVDSAAPAGSPGETAPAPAVAPARYPLPLKSSLEGGLVHFTLEMEYAERADLASGFGTLAWSLPALHRPAAESATGPLGVGRIDWHVLWPASLVPVRIDPGTLTLLAPGSTPDAGQAPTRAAGAPVVAMPPETNDLWRPWPPSPAASTAAPTPPAPREEVTGITLEQVGGSPTAPGAIEIAYLTLPFLEAYRTLLFLCAVAFLVAVFWYPDSSLMLTVTAGSTVILGLLGSALLEGTGELLATALIAFVFLHGMRWAAGPTEEGD